MAKRSRLANPMRGKRHKIQKRLQKSQGLAALVAVQEDIEEAVNETTRQMAELPEELSGCSGAHLLGTVSSSVTVACDAPEFFKSLSKVWLKQ